MSGALDAPVGKAGPPGPEAGWGSLFAAAFQDSRNAMVLLDDRRRHVDVNGAYLQLLGYRRDDIIGRPVYEIVAGGPLRSDAEWAALLGSERETGEAELVCADGTIVGVQWAATPVDVTGRRLALFVALSTSRWGRRFRRTIDAEAPGPLSPREVEVVRLVAQGHSGPEIADELRIAHDTVRTHIRNAMVKVGARSRAHLVAKAMAEGHALR